MITTRREKNLLISIVKFSYYDKTAYPTMPTYYDYPVPFPFYGPYVYNYTYLNRSFPEHHFPFEESRHKLSQSWHEFWNKPIECPVADVRETLHSYYLDIELPGVETKEKVKVKWTNASTLVIEAEKSRPPIPEDVESAGPESSDTHANGAEQMKKSAHPDHPVHDVVRERHIGKHMRAFDFPVDVDREKMTAKLQSGMLTVVVPKVEKAKVEHKEIDVLQ
jgi:HSP20 family molecular chaperone IbpA